MPPIDRSYYTFPSLKSGQLTPILEQLIDESDALACLGRLDIAGEARLHRLAARIHTISALIHDAKIGAIPKPQIDLALSTARDVLSLSPILKRLQTWPRGYKGDFETIETLMTNDGTYSLDDIGGCATAFVHRSPLAQSFKNRSAFLVNCILEYSSQSGDILSISSGAAIEFVEAAKLRKIQTRVALSESDDDALHLAVSRLQKLGVSHDILPKMPWFGGTLKSQRKYSLIILGFALDYLNTRLARAFLTEIWAAVAPGGTLAFACTSKLNPYSSMNSLLANWPVLEHRTIEIASLLDEVCTPNEVAIVGRDGTGIFHLVKLRRPF